MAKPLIAIETIYEKALHLLDTEGLEALNARRLAAELRCSTRTLYEQVGKRDALIRQLVTFQFSRIELSFARHRRWQDSAANWCSGIRNMMVAHPNLSRLMTVADRGIIVEYVNQLLRVLLAAKFPRELAMRGCRVLLHTAISLTSSEIHAPPLAVRRRQRSEPEISFESLMMVELPDREPREFHDAPEVFNSAIRWIIDGLEKELKVTKNKTA